MIQQVVDVHLGWGQTPSLDTKMIYENTEWVLRESYGECLGCYLRRREAFWLPNGASVRRLIRRAPLTPPK